jgi:hypothetical protein
VKSLTESPAVLTVHEGTEGQYILRVADLRHRPLVIQVTKLLEDAQSFVIITPNDVKVFAVGSNGSSGSAATDYESSVPIDAETQAAIDAQEEHSIPGSEEEEPPAPPARTRKRAKPASVAGHDEQCGRCGGQGRVAIMLEGGAPSDAPCPICKGEGVVRRYGARR